MDNSDLRFFQANGQATFESGSWIQTGTVGWTLKPDSNTPTQRISVQIFEPLEAGYLVHVTGLSTGYSPAEEPMCCNIGPTGFDVVSQQAATSPRGFSFSIKGLKLEPVMDDRSVPKDRFVEDANALRLLFTHEAEFGFVTVFCSASIDSSANLALQIAALEAKISAAKTEIAAELDPIKRAALIEALVVLERKLVCLNKLARPEITRYWDSAKEFGKLWGDYTVNLQKNLLGGAYVPLCTGAGPGIMTASASGAAGVGAPVVGIDALFAPQNRFTVKNTAPQFHSAYLRCNDFATREAALINYSQELYFWPGGYGTMWEVFEALSKIQTKHLRPYRTKAVFVHREFWEPILEMIDHLRERGTINAFGDRISILGKDDSDPPQAYVAEVVDSAAEAFAVGRRHVEWLHANNLLSVI